LPDFLVAHVDLEAIGFGQRRALVDHLREDLLFDPELLQELLAHVRSVRGSIRLQLSLIRPTELAGRDLLAFDFRDGLAGRGVGAAATQKVGNVEDDERQADETEAPLEPTHMPAHPIEHCHDCTLPASSYPLSASWFQLEHPS